MAALAVQQESSPTFGRAAFEAHVRAELASRRKVDEACIHYSRTLKWPAMKKEYAIYAHARVVEGLHFGRWLVDEAPPLARRSAKLHLAWLLVSYWGFAGALLWREGLRAKLPGDGV